MKALIVLGLLPFAALAQSSETDSGEVTIYTGGVAGIGSHGTAGGTFATGLTRYIVFLGDISYTPMGSEVLDQKRLAGVSGISRSRLYDFGGAVNIRVPIRERLAPYAILGAGLLYSTYDTASPAASYNNKDFAFHTGAGVRYYIRNNWGVRPEFKVYVNGKRDFARFTVGVFYQFR